jgi:hypothetical protein
LEVFVNQQLTQELNSRKSVHQAHTTAGLRRLIVLIAQLGNIVRMASLIFHATLEATAQDRIGSFGVL